jgi:hypothetical protein
MGKKIRIRIRDEPTGSYLRELRTRFWVKIFKFFVADPGWKKLGSGIRDEKILDPGSGIKSRIRNTDDTLSTNGQLVGCTP